MLLVAVANNNDKLVVGALSVLRDLVYRIAVTYQGIRTSELTLVALVQCVTAPLLHVVTHMNHTACKGLSEWGTTDTLLEWLLLLLEDDRQHPPLMALYCKAVFHAASVPVNLLEKCDT